MENIVKSKGWNWEIVSGEYAEVWKNPAIESFWLLNRWRVQNKKDFLDLGCGLGRHSILFAKNHFTVWACDISQNAVDRTAAWLAEENLKAQTCVCDMLNLPYQDEMFDCILCRNVISHTDTNGMRQIVKELKRILKPNGECYLTLGSKNTWGFQQDWPMVDENTKLRMEEGPEYRVPHFYADYPLILELFKEFKIELIQHIGDYYTVNGATSENYHYHILIKKNG